MRKNEIKEAKMIIDTIKQARCEMHNLTTNSELTAWTKQQREFELCQLINILQSDMVDMVDRMMQNDENKTTLKAA